MYFFLEHMFLECVGVHVFLDIQVYMKKHVKTQTPSKKKQIHVYVKKMCSS